MMSEARQLVHGGPVDGFWIRRAASPAVTAVRRVSKVAAAAENKENIPPPSWAVTARRRSQPRRSPLPEWYPRTPLRDITFIVNALESKRNAAAVRQRNGDPELTPTFQSLKAQILASPLPQEPGVDLTPSNQALPSNKVEAASGSSTVSSLSSLPLSENQLQNSSPECTAIEHPSQSILSSTDLQPTEYEKKLESSIDKFGKLVMKQLKKAPMATAKKPAHFLMSMR